MTNKEEKVQIYIPQNYENNLNFAGFSFKTRNIIEAVFFVTILAVPTYYLCYNILYLNLQLSVYMAIFVGAGIGLLCINGINGDCFTKHIKHLIISKRKERKAIYDPSIKTNVMSYIEQTYNNTNVVVDKTTKFIEKIKNKIPKKEKEEKVEEYEYVFVDKK